MNMDEIKTLEDALLVIDELHKAQATHNIEVEGLNAKCKEYENAKSILGSFFLFFYSLSIVCPGQTKGTGSAQKSHSGRDQAD